MAAATVGFAFQCPALVEAGSWGLGQLLFLNMMK